jgi:hypothetical protein
MRVTLEKGETLDVALVENERIVATFSIELRSISAGAGEASKASEKPRVAQQPAAAAEAAAPAAVKQPRQKSAKARAGKRNITEEARAKMAEAQKRRWAKFRQTKAK